MRTPIVTMMRVFVLGAFVSCIAPTAATAETDDTPAGSLPAAAIEDGAALSSTAMPGIRAVSTGPLDLDDPAVEYLVTSRLGFPEYITLDTWAGKMYWTDWGSRQ